MGDYANRQSRCVYVCVYMYGNNNAIPSSLMYTYSCIYIYTYTYKAHAEYFIYVNVYRKTHPVQRSLYVCIYTHRYTYTSKKFNKMQGVKFSLGIHFQVKLRMCSHVYICIYT